MTGSELRLKRQAAGIPSGMLAGRLSIARSKLSDVERGYVPVSDSEGARISAAIDELIDRSFPVMRARGGFIPTCDHGVPEEVRYEAAIALYEAYVKEKHE